MGLIKGLRNPRARAPEGSTFYRSSGRSRLLSDVCKQNGMYHSEAFVICCNTETIYIRFIYYNTYRMRLTCLNKLQSKKKSSYEYMSANIWPPRSPDFNHSDFYLWGTLKNLCVQLHLKMKTPHQRVFYVCQTIRNHRVTI